MKKSYYIIFDTKEFYEHTSHARYVCITDGDNILHEAFKHAEQNNHTIGDMRIMRFETKKEWEKSYNKWLSQAKPKR